MDPGNPPTDAGVLEWIFKPVEPRSKKETTELSCSRRILNFIINVAVSFCKGGFLLIACALNIGNIVICFGLGPFLFKKLVEFGADNVRYTSVWNIFSMILAVLVATTSFLILPALAISIAALCLKLEEKYKSFQDKVYCQCDRSKSCPQCETKLEKEAEAETMQKAECKVTVDEPPPTYKDCLGKEEDELPGYTAVMEAVTNVTDVTALMEKKEDVLHDYTAAMTALV